MDLRQGKKFWVQGEFYLLITFSLVGVVFFLMTWSFSPTAALFPRIVTFVVGVLSLYTLAGWLRARYKKEKGEKAAPDSSPGAGMAWYVSLSAMVAYFILIYVAGFVLATLIYLLALPLMMGYKRKVTAAVVAVIFAVIIYFSFGAILHVPLPAGWLGKLLG